MNRGIGAWRLAAMLLGIWGSGIAAPAWGQNAPADPPASPGENVLDGVTVRFGDGRLVGPLARIQIAVAAESPDARQTDLTRAAAYESLTPEVVGVSKTGLVRPLSAGKGIVRVTLEVAGQRQDHECQFTVSETDRSVSFRHDVIPLLNRAGCNAGACHGAQYGKGELKLSLLGYAPEQDYPPLVRDFAQRRVSLVQPEDSLLLQKATLSTGHGGGRRFHIDSYEYEVLLRWIRGGAPGPHDDEPDVVDLKITPPRRVYRAGEHQQLRVVAQLSDGSERDVTAGAMYDSMGDAVAQVTPGGYVTARGSGQAPIMVRYLGQAKISMVVVPFAEQVDLAGFEPRNLVDQFVVRQWRELGLSPSPLCDDSEFVRRAFLDAIGTLPPPERVREFLDSADPDKRDQLVDELLGLTGDADRDRYVDQWSAYWGMKWGDLLRNNRNKLGDGGMWALYNWMRSALRENMPVDEFVRELITAQGSVFQSGPANYYKITSKPDELAEATAQIFLGVRLQCAKCHHHPFEVYSQADYYGLAAFFTRVNTKKSDDFGSLGGDTVVLVRRSGSIRHPRTGKVMAPTPLLGEPLQPDAYRDLRRPLAEWLTSPENPLFARNIANRIWGYLMGSGLVEPIDDMRATNPPSNPELLDALAEDFVRSGYNLRHLMRVIMTSHTYQLSSTPTPSNVADTRFYTHYNLRRLPAEVLLDAIDFACGTQEKFAGIPGGTRAIELPDPNYASYFLDTLGRPQRVITCECERTAEPNLAQVLHVSNGELLSGKTASKDGRIAQLLARELPDEEIVRELYFHTVSRPPSAEEIASCVQIIARAPNRREGLEDLLWALCNSREFLFNH